MQDTIKTYKPKKSKKIVRRKGGKSIAQGLGSLIGGTGLGYATRDVDIWPEGTSLPVQIGAETGWTNGTRIFQICPTINW